MESPEGLWRYEEVAKYLNVCESTLRYWVHTKAIRHYKLGRLVRFSPSELREDLENGVIGESVFPIPNKQSSLRWPGRTLLKIFRCGLAMFML